MTSVRHSTRSRVLRRLPAIGLLAVALGAALPAFAATPINQTRPLDPLRSQRRHHRLVPDSATMTPRRSRTLRARWRGCRSSQKKPRPR